MMYLNYLVAFLWILSVIVLLWFGNRFIFRLLDKSVSWLKYTARRFFLQLMLSCIYSLACINLSYYLFKITSTVTPPDLAQILVLNIYGLLFIIPVLSVNFGIYFMMQWKKEHIKSDQLKQENLNSQLEALRMHIDPHFLFNNLNVLSTLIEENSRDAQFFLERFADVYRYVLQYKKEELVALNTEITFIRSYVFLLKKRFEEQCIIDIDIPGDLPDTMCIPPLSLQMLVENAIKHNKISLKSPLMIGIFIEHGTTLVVRNNYQPKPNSESKLANTGLENISKRYKYLSDSAITVVRDENSFVVKLPLLELED
ncbi:LytS/YehU family sensor histidine kinase [Pedobacter sp. AK017]|uniref:sensor histidine kinase n=1 Tax=Pedobacter sp. AK017 TaxID=2723073 RepID=UPI0016167890|nr:histidine kinase [Pedobacter sp. AK017]MBB5437789.1 LytS/YehU family sensor histidine kinase [Pedobacter sp. AK017]